MRLTRIVNLSKLVGLTQLLRSVNAKFSLLATNGFAKGMRLVDEEGLNFKVMTDRRELTSEVEIHTHYTGIIYAPEGAATFVTGCQIVHPKTVAPGEILSEPTQRGVAQ